MDRFSSPLHGLDFSWAAWSEMGARGRAARHPSFRLGQADLYIHFRDGPVQGRVPASTNASSDEGTLDKFEIVSRPQEVGFDASSSTITSPHGRRHPVGPSQSGLCHRLPHGPHPVGQPGRARVAPPVRLLITPTDSVTRPGPCAVMAAIRRVRPARSRDLHDGSRMVLPAVSGGDFGYHEVVHDIGMVQSSPLHEDLEATVRSSTPSAFDPALVSALASDIRHLGCSAWSRHRASGSLLWRTRPTAFFSRRELHLGLDLPGLCSPRRSAAAACPLTCAAIFASPVPTIQTRPVCLAAYPRAHLVVGPVSRASAHSADRVRVTLQVPPVNRVGPPHDGRHSRRQPLPDGLRGLPERTTLILPVRPIL